MGALGDLDSTGAACMGSPDDFFPERGTAQISARDAKKVCNGEAGGPVCPIRERCLEYALERKERFGIWGGKSERERARIAKARRVAAKEQEQAWEVAASTDRRSASAKRAWENRRTPSVASRPSLNKLLADGLITAGEHKQQLLRNKTRSTRGGKTSKAGGQRAA